MSRSVNLLRQTVSSPAGLAFELGVVYRHAQIMSERAALWAKLLELECDPKEVREGIQRLLVEAMTLHAEVESCVKIAAEVE